MVGASAITATGKSVFSYTFLILVLSFMLLNAAVIAIENKSITPALEYLGSKIANSVDDLKTDSEKIIAQGGIYTKEKGLFDSILTISGLLSSLFVIYGWIYILAYIIERSISDSTAIFRNYLMAIFVFIVLEIIYLLAFTEIQKTEALTLPFTAFYEFFRAIPYIVHPISKIVDTANNNTIVSNITRYVP